MRPTIAVVLIVTAVPCRLAIACAPSPVEAAKRYLEAQASCDFVTAWGMLAPVERDAFSSDPVVWSSGQAEAAEEQIGCHDQIEGVALEGYSDDRSAHIQYVLSEPASVVQFRRLLRDLEVAPVLEWGALRRAIQTTRIQLTANDRWEPRIRSPRTIGALRSDTGWCVYAGHAVRQAAARLAMEAADRRAAAEAAERAAIEQRSRAAQEAVTAENVRVGVTALREPGVWGEVVNRSSETLRKVQVRLEYLDESGAVVGERMFYPLLPPPIRGGYVAERERPIPPGQRRTFGVRTDNAPANWSRRVRVSVIEVEVDPNQQPRAATTNARPTPPLRR